MIAIVNVGPHDDPDKLGVRTYEVRINANVVCTFKHRRADGLGMCLLKASKAVERQKWEQASRILDIANRELRDGARPSDAAKSGGQDHD